jgi:hypothetical protein
MRGNEVMKKLDHMELPPLVAKADRAMKEAVARAIAEHWRAGRPVYIWENERVVALLPDGTRVPLEKGQHELVLQD